MHTPFWDYYIDNSAPGWHTQAKWDRPCNKIVGAVITVDTCQKVFRYADTYPSENNTSITLHQVDTHSQEKYDRPCNEIMGAVITVDQCQKVVRYSDTHPSENTITITPHQVDTHPQEKCDRGCNEIVGAVITVDQCQKCLFILKHTLLRILYR